MYRLKRLGGNTKIIFIIMIIIIMIIKFYNRENELKLLEKVSKPFLAIIYGRRRIGKTSLVLKYAENKDYLYFFINPKKPENLLLEGFSEELRNKLRNPYIRPKNWEEFFDVLFQYDGLVIFDEFQWFLEINKEVPFILQKFWDIKKHKPSIIITGSVVGMIKKLFLEHGSPLFKRSDIIIKLKDFRIKTVFEILDDLGIKDLEEKFKFYLLFGGVPYYYKLLFKYQINNISSAIKELVIDEYAPLKKEVEEVIMESFKREYKTYLSILLAIAEGKTKLEDIASTAGIKATSLPKYLDDLINLLELVEKQKIGFKKKHIYLIKDKFHNFWLRFVYKPNIISEDKLFKYINENINQFYGWSFETTIRENILKIFPNFDESFKYIGKKENGTSFDIDVVCLDKNNKEILFCECKWKDGVNAKKIVKDLIENSKYIDWHKGERKQSYAIFAKSFKEKITEFEDYPVKCIDLKDLEKMLITNH